MEKKGENKEIQENSIATVRRLINGAKGEFRKFATSAYGLHIQLFYA